MTITTQSLARPGECRGRHRLGFTLVEVLISLALATTIIAAVLTSFLMLGRSGANLVNYTDMESEARKGLEVFAQDTRMAREITWNSLNSVTLVVPVTGGFERYTYAYNAGTRRFTRQRTGPTTGPVQVLITGITAFNFKAYQINASEVDLAGLDAAGNLSQANPVTKQLQISLNASRTTRTVVGATNTVLSARFILRNKRVTT